VCINLHVLRVTIVITQMMKVVKAAVETIDFE
jgi:hypothetical protein